MALRGKQPELIQKRLKCLFYGVAGAGKTTAAISFPSVYLIDTEKGAENAQYLDIIKQGGGAIYQCSDFGDILNEVKALLSEKHPYKTLVIDPLTVLYDNLLEVAAAIPTKDGTEATAFGKHYQHANRKMKQLLQMLLRLDMNVIITAHAKAEYGKDMVKLGETFDCYKKLDYLFDLVIEIRKIGLKRIGIVRKTRISTFEEGSDFEFSYSTIAQKYGKDIIEREALSEELAKPEQLKELDRLVKLLKVPQDVTDKWLLRANSSSFGDMSSSVIGKCIESLQHKLEGKE
jgi:hypothetical protein